MGRLRECANPNAMRLQLNRWLRPLDLGVDRPSHVEAKCSAHSRVSLPEGAEATLRPEHPRLRIVHNSPELYALEANLSRHGYDDVLSGLGYRRVDLRPKYAHSDTLQRLGVFAAWHHAFERG